MPTFNSSKTAVGIQISSNWTRNVLYLPMIERFITGEVFLTMGMGYIILEILFRKIPFNFALY